MLVALYIVLGFLFFDCLIACCLYFRKEPPLEKLEEYSNYLKAEKSSQKAKTTKDNIRRQKNIMLDNKRKFPRFNFTSDVEFNASGVAFSGMTKNVSRDGMSFVIENCSAEAGSQLQFQMQNPQKEDTIEAYGDIIWKRKMDDKWHLGLHFQLINSIDKFDILDVAYDNWLSSILKSQQVIHNHM